MMEEESAGPQHNWKYTTRLPIYDRMSEILKLAITATEKQLEAERRKLRKMQYGG